MMARVLQASIAGALVAALLAVADGTVRADIAPGTVINQATPIR